ncbi:aluminum-activated malate transporter 1-like [Miscanthus floridulus]|uniref:aluminum-activated malate transporter 1-like n=1 Tax=Miscanthus floridulus TaxID=154761 RepID=UPI0034597784
MEAQAPAPTTESSSSSAEGSNGGGGVSCRARCCRRRWLRSAPERVWISAAAGFCFCSDKVARIAREDPRRVAHSLKVGLALTLVSVVYYLTPLFDGLGGGSAMWAVLTVVIVMEFTVGATLSKGLNRALATLVASSLAVGAHEVASLVAARSEKAESIILAVFVFFVASAATFSRFIPEVKARFDYGVSIFILSFSLVAVSSYRVEELRPLALQRISTIFVGVAICLGTTVLVFPVWAGEDLHRLAAGNIHKLADFLQGLESECFGENSGSENLEGKDFLRAYKSVLSSKDKEDSLCTLAQWEPPHGRFRFRHPWSQYKKLGTLCRQCASSMEAIASYVVIVRRYQYPEAKPELCLKVQTLCGQMSNHSARTLRELASALQSMTTPSITDESDLSDAMKAASACRSELLEDAVQLQVMHTAVIASLLSDLVMQINKITESVGNLARLARFRNPEKTRTDVVIDVKT